MKIPAVMTRPSSKDVQESLERWLAELATQVDQTAGRAGFWHLLEGMSRLWDRYSVMNACLIWSQLPRASSVAGKRRWEKLGRTVRHGEVPAFIRAPSGSKGRGFVFVEVYDISQALNPARIMDLSGAFRENICTNNMLQDAAQSILTKGLSGVVSKITIDANRP